MTLLSLIGEAMELSGIVHALSFASFGMCIYGRKAIENRNMIAMEQ